MDYGFAAVRLLHVLSTMFWIGIAVTNITFIVPAAAKAGPEGGRFMSVLLKGPLIRATNGAIVLAAVTGIYLYWHNSMGQSGHWDTSAAGTTFAIGALFGLAAAGVFGALTTPTFRKMVRLGGEMAAAGGPPKPEQVSQMDALRSRSLMIGRLNAGLLVIALIFMVIGGSY
ncbi:MAG: hypothetical protein ACHQ0J_01340 [Candidatus Dormibacterales bacterium]